MRISKSELSAFEYFGLSIWENYYRRTIITVTSRSFIILRTSYVYFFFMEESWQTLHIINKQILKYYINPLALELDI